MAHWLENVIKNVSTDCVIFGFENSLLKVLLYKRAKNPCKGLWALPGGFLKKGEYTEQAARRILKATTGLTNVYLEQVGVFDEIKRFPSWRVFTVGYFALIQPNKFEIIPFGSESIEVKWFDIKKVPPLAWDHSNILEVSLIKLRDRLLEKPIGFELLQKKFTLPQLQVLYEAILGKSLDKRNFRKKIISMHLLKRLKEKDRVGKGRAANLYRFDKHTY